MNHTIKILFLLFVALATGCNPVRTYEEVAEKPNLLVIMTDEHNFRTLGCYRDILPPAQAFVWGEGLKVETPNIDFLADEGVLLSKFYSVTPVCSPSRGSFVSGLYPQKTGVPVNDVPMYDHVITFAEVLKEAGYETGYAGKWHLDGEGKPQWEPARKFGFTDNRYMFNRGHWKKLADTPQGPKVDARNNQGSINYDLNGADEKSYTTDFLTDKTIEFIKKNKDNPFCYMVSYPDPHGPDRVRPPYDTMYNNLAFKAPLTYNKTGERIPSWAMLQKKVGIDQSNYFGMVKCIDDNIGRIINHLRQNGLLDKTIIVFTSDHGDLRAEHRRQNKGVPLEASAKVPFIVYAPSLKQKGQNIGNAFNSVDFAPTILGLMALKNLHEMDGTDFSELLMDPDRQEGWQDFTVVRSTAKNRKWIAAVTSRYKLVLSEQDGSWLLDLEINPDETINYIDHSENQKVVRDLANKLKAYAEKYDEPFLQNTELENELSKLCIY